MMRFNNNTKVKVLEHAPFKRSDAATSATNDEPVLNPARNHLIHAGRKNFDRRPKKGLSRCCHPYKLATLNCRTLRSEASCAELDKLMESYNITVTCIQEHRLVHSDSDPDIVARSIGSSTLFTSSALRNVQNASIGGVAIAINTKFLPLLESVKKVNERIVKATFKGNPKTVVISCYSPHNSLPEEDVTNFYSSLSNTVDAVPPHSMLLIGGDMNAQIAGGFSLHLTTNRNGHHLVDFIRQHNLIVGNTSFQKHVNKLWTHRSPKGDLSQIDFVLYRKRWRNSIKDCQAYSSSNAVGSDHRIVTASIQLSLRRPKARNSKKLFWRALTTDPELASQVENSITSRFNDLPSEKQDYSTFVSIANTVGTEFLPEKPKPPVKTVDTEPVVTARGEALLASPSNIQPAQNLLHATFNSVEDKRINDTLLLFENPAAPAAIKNAWNLVKELSGKRTQSTIFIQGDNRLKTWEDHFKNLLNASQASASGSPIEKVFSTHIDIQSGEFSQAEVNTAVSQMKNGKAPGLDGLPAEFWKLPKVKKLLCTFCNDTYKGNRPKEWGLSGITPVPKKGDLTITDNYRGISLTQVASKVYNRCLLNRIRPAIETVLRPNQNGFRKGRSTTSHILALRRIVEELKNHDMEAVFAFIDFRKAFDSIDRNKMFQILEAYGIPSDVVAAIRVMYVDTSAIVLTPEGETNQFSIDTGVLQGDPLAPFLFIICLDYALRSTITDLDGLVLKRSRSRRHPAQVLSDLDYADDIALIENNVAAAQDLLIRVEKACQDIGLFLNAPKTKYMHVNPSSTIGLFSSDGTPIDLVQDFKYLGGYTNTAYDMNIRIGQAWSALNALNKVWKSTVKKDTKLKVFKASVETILLYSSDSWTLNATQSKKLDGTYTRMLRAIYNIPWQEFRSNKELYGTLPRISSVVKCRRLKLAGHVTRHDEPAGKVLLWTPEAKRRVGRPAVTIKTLLVNDTGLVECELSTAMKDRCLWKKNFVNVSPSEDG